MKRKNILLLVQISAVLFLLLLSPVLAQNSYVISLDGVDRFGVTAGGDLNVSTAWTFEAWIKVGNYVPDNREYIMDRDNVFSFFLLNKGLTSVGDYAIAFVARDDLNNIIAALASDGSGDDETPMDFDTWYHVAATYDGITAKLYINNTLTDENADLVNWNLSASFFALNMGGRNDDDNNWVGQMSNTDIDEIRMSDIARAIGDMQTTTSDDPYSVDGSTIFLMHLDDQEVSPDGPTYISGVGFIAPIFSENIALVDYVPPSGLPLPVELISFSAQVNEGEVTLNWETETEVDNYGFDVERKEKDYQDWTKIGFIEGHGNSNSPKQYSFTDQNPWV